MLLYDRVNTIVLIHYNGMRQTTVSIRLFYICTYSSILSNGTEYNVNVIGAFVTPFILLRLLKRVVKRTI